MLSASSGYGARTWTLLSALVQHMDARVLHRYLAFDAAPVECACACVTLLGYKPRAGKATSSETQARSWTQLWKCGCSGYSSDIGFDNQGYG